MEGGRFPGANHSSLLDTEAKVTGAGCLDQHDAASGNLCSNKRK